MLWNDHINESTYCERADRQDFKQAAPTEIVQQPIGWRRRRDRAERSQHDHPAVGERDALSRKPGDDGLQPGHQ